jgi:hypothetical protein
MLALVIGGLFALISSALLAWVFLRLARQEEKDRQKKD